MRTVAVHLVVVFAMSASAVAQSPAVREVRDVRAEIQVALDRHQLIKVDVRGYRAPLKGYVEGMWDQEFDLVGLDGHQWRIAYDVVRGFINPLTGEPIAVVHEPSAKSVQIAVTVAGGLLLWAILHTLARPMP